MRAGSWLGGGGEEGIIPTRRARPPTCSPVSRPPLLCTAQGNLSALVAVRPEARTYYELSAATLRFKFPDPGFLDGIKGKTQAIAKMTGVSVYARKTGDLGGRGGWCGRWVCMCGLRPCSAL